MVSAEGIIYFCEFWGLCGNVELCSLIDLGKYFVGLRCNAIFRSIAVNENV